jgi:BASS family bile acid:Na+ symporter
MVRVLENNFHLVLAVFIALGLFSWDLSISLFNYVKPMLGIVIFSMALTLRFKDFLPCFKKPKALLIGILAQYLIMPTIAFILAKVFALPNDFAIGLILVGSCPGGTVSNVISYIAKANLALSITMTFFSTLLSPIMIPFLMWVFASHWVEINALGLFISTIQLVVLPIALGLSIKYFFKIKESKLINNSASLISIFFVCFIIHAMVAKNISKILELDNLLNNLLIIFAAIVLHNISGYLIAYFYSKKFELSLEDRKAISIEVGIQNSGLASVLALSFFNPLSVIPAIISASWHAFSGSLLASFWSSGEKNETNKIKR